MIFLQAVAKARCLFCLTPAREGSPMRAMNTDKPAQPRSDAEARREREAEALRANLLRRKEQQRARRPVPPPEPQAIPPDPAG